MKKNFNRKQFMTLCGWISLGGFSFLAALKRNNSSTIFTQEDKSLKSVINSSPSYPPPPSGTKLLSQNLEVITVNLKGEETRRKVASSKSFRITSSGKPFLEMMAIPGGEFMMGSPSEEMGNDLKEKPRHRVSVPPFYMGKYPVTQAQWYAVMGNNPSFHRDRGDSFPVTVVSWYEALEFCAKLSTLTKLNFNLPTEAQWEYACRGGTTTPFYLGETLTFELANYNSYSTYADELPQPARARTTKVDNFPPNAFGLYDLHGNVSEWCLDVYHEDYQGVPTDGSAWGRGSNVQHNNYRVLRGGSYSDPPWDCRSAFRVGGGTGVQTAFIGFRVVCNV
ncbi:formylglycine-generating enzyme family protein [Gloeothece verrucosa]|uniref:Sulfatase-modifying factor enzyme-like domain-containing protein n=1 Tax=Gloeothece verrucosa (strain PCC 7822) TaxID=497965 RepID=E0UN17_GLOV7|nr:formylglycine-generating enzyme family protein [Gloeothece verrucosa]ADN18347.1 protein of unknown function DUF323 [Gloeothece verrucosa PCC 7822]